MLALWFGVAVVSSGLPPAAHGMEPDLSISTAIRAISDPFSGAGRAKMIPGAVVEYCIDVDNRGAETAQHIRINMPLPDQVTVMDGTLSLHESGCEDPPTESGRDVTINSSDGTIEALIDFIAPGATWSARFNATIN